MRREPPMKNVAVTLWIVACLAVFLYRAGGFIRANSATFDEAVHLSAGYSYWARGDFRLNHETPPLSKLLAALPLYLFKQPKFEPTPDQWADSAIWQIGNDFVFRNNLPPAELLAWGRWATVPLGVALILLVGRWAYRRFGLWSAVFAITAAAAEPNLLAFSCLVNSDMAPALFAFASAYTTWEYFQTRRRLWFALTGTATGLALASKFSALFFVPGLLLCWLVVLEEDRLNAVFRLVLIASVTVAACYFLVGFAHFGSGLKQQLSRNDFDPPEFYLRGAVSSLGWWNYFPIVAWHKTVTIWLLPIGLALFFNVFSAAARAQPNRRHDLVFILPVSGLILAVAVLRVDLGIRVVLPAAGFALVWLGGVRSSPNGFPLAELLGRITGIALIAGILVSLSYPTRELAYYSLSPFDLPHRETETERSEGAVYTFGDSNLDWGQDLLRLKEWMGERGQRSIYLAYTGSAPPEAYGIAFVPLPAWGRVEPYPRPPNGKPDYAAVSVSCLQGLHLKDRAAYKWLLASAPVSRLGGAIWIYDMRNDPGIRARIERLAEQVPHGQ